jgi:tripartite motif-containing protein 71
MFNTADPKFYSYIYNHKNQIFKVDYVSHQVHIFSMDGRLVKTFGKYGDKDGEFNYPRCIAVDKQTDTVFVTDSKRVQVFDTKGNFVSKFDFPFKYPFGITIIQQKIFVTDFDNHCIQVFCLLQKDYRFLYTIGKKGTGKSEFDIPFLITSSSHWNNQDLLFVCDYGNYRIQILSLIGDFVSKFSNEYSYGIAVGSNFIYTCHSNSIRVWN